MTFERGEPRNHTAPARQSQSVPIFPSSSFEFLDRDVKRGKLHCRATRATTFDHVEIEIGFPLFRHDSDKNKPALHNALQTGVSCTKIRQSIRRCVYCSEHRLRDRNFAKSTCPVRAHCLTSILFDLPRHQLHSRPSFAAQSPARVQQHLAFHTFASLSRAEGESKKELLFGT